MKRWRLAQRWTGAAALPTDALTTLTMRQELEAIVDRRQWEPTEPPTADSAADRRSVDNSPSDRAA